MNCPAPIYLNQVDCKIADLGFQGAVEYLKTLDPRSLILLLTHYLNGAESYPLFVNNEGFNYRPTIYLQVNSDDQINSDSTIAGNDMFANLALQYIYEGNKVTVVFGGFGTLAGDYQVHGPQLADYSDSNEFFKQSSFSESITITVEGGRVTGITMLHSESAYDLNPSDGSAIIVSNVSISIDIMNGIIKIETRDGDGTPEGLKPPQEFKSEDPSVLMTLGRLIHLFVRLGTPQA